MKLNTSSKKSFFQRNRTTTVEIEIDFPKELQTLGPLICDFFHNCELPLDASMQVSGSSELKNFRGRQVLSGSSEELLFLNGSAVELTDGEAPDGEALDGKNAEADQSQDKLDLSCEIFSAFLRTENKKDIVYKTNSELTKQLSEEVPDLSFSQLFKLVPVSWRELRFGIELFKPAFFGSMLGSSPLIVKRFYMDLNLKGLKVFIEDGSSKKVAVPFEKEKLITALEHSFADYLKKESIQDSIIKQIS